MTDEIRNLVAQLKAVEALLASPLHKLYVDARKKEIEVVKERILNLVPISQDNIAMQLLAHGELDTLNEMVTLFEDNARSLKKRISELTDLENENASETKV